MKEHFKHPNLKGKIKIKLNDERVWVADKIEILSAMVKVCEDYKQYNYTLTLRQLYYQLVAKDLIPNHDKVYKKMSSLKKDLLYGGIVDWDVFEDRGRVPVISDFYNDIPSALNHTYKSYRLDRQKGQEVHVEVWTEKDAISSILKRITYPMGIRLVVNKGYTSDTSIYEAYTRFKELIEDGKKITILYFGDHDPSGLDMVRDIKDRLLFFFEKGSNWGHVIEHDDFKVRHIGLTMDQIKVYNPPYNPAKMTDTRANKYIKIYGQKSWEVDALNPQVMETIVEDAIQEEIDMYKFNMIIDQEGIDRDKIKKIVADIK